MRILYVPEDEVELGEGEHGDPQQGGDGAVGDGGEHVLQRQLCPPGAVTEAADKTLKKE